ncbi:MAG TPA: 30S ribosomal protein S20 [Syntrophorhabdaceae bacterium]|nr:30S ribosomal protein S20 [Syntrophorhabdaceae bacterium]
MKKNKSAIKRARQAEERRLRNSHYKSTMKTYVKKTMTSMGSKDIDRLGEDLKKAISYIDKTASKGVIHRKTASRKISRLTKKVNKILGATGKQQQAQ